MKKLKLISIVCAALCLVLLCTSCGKVKPAVLSDYLNEDYTFEEKNLSSSLNMVDFEGYKVIKYNSHFVVLNKITYASPEAILANPDLADAAPTVSYKIFSLDSGKAIANYDGICAFKLYDNAPMILVAKSQLDTEDFKEIVAEGITGSFGGGGIDSEGNIISGSLVPSGANSTNYTVYDGAGNVMFNAAKQPEAPTLFADYVVFNYSAYSLDESTGALTSMADMNEFVTLEKCAGWNDDYYYATDSTSSELYIYNTDFELVYNWIAPSYAEECTIQVLNNGNVFVQYLYGIDGDSKKYDAYFAYNGLTAKYNLVSFIFSVEDGSIDEQDLDYLVIDIKTNYALNDVEDENNKPYTDSFENIAYIAPIVDKKLDYSDSNIDVVTMSNELKIEKDLKVIENQAAALPEKISGNLYRVEMVNGGYALIDSEGTVKNKVNVTGKDWTNDYIIGDSAIYSYDLAKAYDLYTNNATVEAIMDDSILIKAKTAMGYDMVLLYDGNSKVIYTYNRSNLEQKTFFDYNEGDNFYCINQRTTDAVTGKVTNNYTYYNAEGTPLLTSQIKLESVSSSDNCTLLKGTNDINTPVYFVFKY